MSDQKHEDVTNYFISVSDLTQCKLLTYAGINYGILSGPRFEYLVEDVSTSLDRALKWPPTDSGRASARKTARWLKEYFDAPFEVVFLKNGATRLALDSVHE